jgi:hypothetical protein
MGYYHINTLYANYFYSEGGWLTVS